MYFVHVHAHMFIHIQYTFLNLFKNALRACLGENDICHAFLVFLQDTSDSELIMGMLSVLGIDYQAWNFNSEKVKSDLWNIIPKA